VQKPINNNRTQSTNDAHPGSTSGRNYGGHDRGNFQQLDQDRVGRQNG
jgi:hypothetical protein